MSRRAEKLSEEIRREVSRVIRDEIKDPRISTLLSITQVEVSRDLGYARIFVSQLGDQDNARNTLDGLESAKGFIRRELGKRLRLRLVPEIAFILDDSIEHGAHISRLIEKIKKNEGNNRENDGI